jgi:hypothetical protein
MKQLGLIIIIISITGTLQAQQLPSEKPVATFYSKTTQKKLNDRQPAALKARQELPSQKAAQQPSVPARIKPAKAKAKANNGDQKLASEKPVDMDKINRQRARKKPE